VTKQTSCIPAAAKKYSSFV